VKLSATSLIEKETKCDELKNPEPKQTQQKKPGKSSLGQADYQRFLPE